MHLQKSGGQKYFFWNFEILKNHESKIFDFFDFLEKYFRGHPSVALPRTVPKKKIITRDRNYSRSAALPA